MGMIQKLKSAFSIETREQPKEPEFTRESEEEPEEPEPEPEEEEPSWDTAYRMVDEVSQERGFSGLDEAIAKSMSMTVRESGMFRDRIESGRRTIESVSGAVSKLEDVRGSGESLTEYGEIANRLDEAADLVDSVEKFTDSEEMMVRRGMHLADKAIDTFKETQKSGVGGGVKTKTTESEEKL